MPRSVLFAFCFLLLLSAARTTLGQAVTVDETGVLVQESSTEPTDVTGEALPVVEPSVGPEAPESAGGAGTIESDDEDHHDHHHEHDGHDHTDLEHSEDSDWVYRSENSTNIAVNSTYEPEMNATTEFPGNFTTDLPGNTTGSPTNSSGAPLSCFVCSTVSEPVCDDPFSETAAEAAGLLQECPAVPGLRTVCRKSWQVVPGDTRVIRSCGHDNDVRACFVTAEATTASHVCHCYEDGCNGASRAQMTVLAVLSFVVVQAFR
ncbi:uncharacterized protein LOC122393041 [Amphibalanus amphitrite]|uniref:uncharacterized protein LOC122393041 n=1 Tax=Amphibalanus amphitrite TaxID=1232801 RepID=UPI001C912060|nr:uncharacterized protein LOC122393041 [Amphibalanus amphitrite]